MEQLKKAKVIMIQGTMSDAGKSLIVAGLCRILKQDGYKVAPFKSQNMALNSFITKDGLEMGRAQVVQAEACEIEPDVSMNPILLKPSSDIGSQVIVNGEVIGNMNAKDYFAYKKELIPVILEAFNRLSANYDIIVIEGAGSPAEINLKSEDIVNMGLAELVNAPVLLVGDIDRGGVFAQLYGTVELLTKDERKRIKGLIINKFRGDTSILEPGLKMLEEKCRIPVAGVIPYMKVDIEDEDSLSPKLMNVSNYNNDTPIMIDICVICLPKISNFTDFDVFSRISGVRLRYVSLEKDLGNPDMIIIPGTKSTIADLIYIRENGLEAAIIKKASSGCVIFGICGGYQMLGEEIYDPMSVESDIKKIRGMGLLSTITSFYSEKTRTRIEGTFSNVDGILSEIAGIEIFGYEIHMGNTILKRGKSLMAINTISKYDEKCKSDNEHSQYREDGTCSENIYGTYVHGIFDSVKLQETIINSLLKKKGLSIDSLKLIDSKKYKEDQYNKLADVIRQNMDMELINKLLE
jgi:cobyric acid synthase CobQ